MLVIFLSFFSNNLETGNSTGFDLTAEGLATSLRPGAPLPYKVLLRRNRSLKKKKKKKKKKNPVVLNHGSTVGTGLLTAPSRLYLNFFFACGAIFPFLLRKKGFDV